MYACHVCVLFVTLLYAVLVRLKFVYFMVLILLSTINNFNYCYIFDYLNFLTL